MSDTFLLLRKEVDLKMGQVKIIQTDNLKEFEETVNERSKELNAFATQTHVTVVHDKIWYTAVLFHK